MSVFLRRRNRMSLAGAGQQVGVTCDPFFASVSDLMNWNQSATLASNTNLGSGSDPSYSGYTTSSSPVIEGDFSMITTGTNNLATFDAYAMTTSNWTIELATRYNGVVFPGVGDLVDHDHIVNYNATTSNRSFFWALRGLGSTHGMRLVFSQNGTTNDVIADVDLLQTLSIDTNYRWALTREGANVHLHLDGTYIDSVAIGAGYSFHTTGIGWGIGQRQSGSTVIASGRYDQYRFTQGVARYSSSNYTVVESFPAVAC